MLVAVGLSIRGTLCVYSHCPALRHSGTGTGPPGASQVRFGLAAMAWSAGSVFAGLGKALLHIFG